MNNFEKNSIIGVNFGKNLALSYFSSLFFLQLYNYSIIHDYEKYFRLTDFLNENFDFLIEIFSFAHCWLRFSLVSYCFVHNGYDENLSLKLSLKTKNINSRKHPKFKWYSRSF